ncbi:hypothetical protein [Micromonospora sp. NPDC049891]|uniref:hypothetical protein n=1 Tax=Micromonospora sp. NPDC049891 TaxID=3155655 RepID=UPI0033E40109
MTDVRCWWCGVEPDTVIEDWRLNQPHPDLIYNWPAGDHQHAVTPPSPQQLEADGHDTLRRIMEAL